MFSSSIGRFFLSFSFFFSLSYPGFFFRLLSLLSFFSFLSLSFAVYTFTYRLLVMLLQSVVSFSFLLSPLPPVFLHDFFSLHLPLYSSTVLIFRWQFAFCSCLVSRVASLVGFAFVCRFLFICSGFVFYEPDGGGGGRCLSYSIFRSVCSLSLSFAWFSLPFSFFRLLSSLPPMSCFCFAALVVLVVVVHCRSSCRLDLCLSIAFFVVIWKVLVFAWLSGISLVVVVCFSYFFFMFSFCFRFFLFAGLSAFHSSLALWVAPLLPFSGIFATVASSFLLFRLL